jgi:DSF synthase
MSTHTYSNDTSLEKFKQVDVQIDPDYGIVWVYQNPYPRPCFNPELISEVRKVQHMLEIYDGQLPYKGELIPIHYHVLDSHSPGIFSMGGDLNLFRDHILRQDKEGLLKYAKSCIDTIHGFITGFRLPVTTISLVRGDALGGGFEVALSGNVVIAEKNIEMGFPEILFNIFPGMGGYHLLSQRLPASQVDRMMLNGRIYNTEELYDMGVIDVLSEHGEGREAVYSYIEKNSRYRNGYLAMQKVHQKVHPVSYEDMMDVCAYWVDVAMQISERDLRIMKRLVDAQNKKAAAYCNEDVKLHHYA